jgi:hypothetical protein
MTRSGARLFAPLLVLTIALSPLARTTNAALQDRIASGGGHRDDPCTHLPDPPGRAHGIDKQCPAGGSSSGVAKGDFNGDGWADLAIGEPGATIGGAASAGDVMVILGSSTGLTTTGKQLWYEGRIPGTGTAAAGDLFGSALASGDFNGDGFSDLAIGIPGRSVTFQNTVYDDWGRVAVIYGSANGLTTTDATVPAPKVLDLSQHFTLRDGHAAPGAKLGSALAWGDYNGDGAGDLSIGAPNYTLDRGLFNAQKPEAGAVWIVFGKKKSSTTVGGLSTVLSELLQQDDLLGTVAGSSLSGDHFGAALTSGDFDGDGLFDLAIGIPTKQFEACFLFCSTDLTEGEVIVLAGTSVGIDPTAFQNPFGGDITEPGAKFGSVLAAGDFDHDGKADLAIGRPNDVAPNDYHPYGSNIGGSVVVIYGPIIDLVFNRVDRFDLDSIQHEFLASGARFGAALAAGDFNGDGKADLAIGAPSKDLQLTFNGPIIDRAGEVNVIYGSANGLSLDIHPPQKWNQSTGIKAGTIAAGNRFGSSLTAWNFGRNDRPVFSLFPIATADLAIGAPYQSVGGNSGAGSVSVMYGSASLNGLTGVNSNGVSNNVVFTADSIGFGGLPGAHFGAALY